MNKQILIVEDENDCAELLSYHLQKESYQTVIARNGEEAIDAVQCHAPDAILLDVMMPELNGWEVCRILRESTKGKSLPIIMLSALSDEEARVKGLSLGADDYVSKPYSMQELLLKVRKHIDRQEAIKLLRTKGREQETSLRYLLHEIRNSMTVIGGFSSLALKKENPRTYLKPIQTAAALAESLLNDAALLSRLEEAGGSLPAEVIDLGATAREAADLFHQVAKKRRIAFVVMESAGPSPVRANKTAARQVLVNVLSNAVKYSREGGRVWIYFHQRDDLASVSIRDEGNGIGPDDLPRIFEKFYRAPGSERVKGEGLGLYIVKLLTGAMGGTITVKSVPGAGSTFTVSFMKVDAVALHSEQDVA